MSNRVFKLLPAFQRALSSWVINAPFILSAGLFHGRMGCVLFAAIYAQYTKDTAYERFAEILLDDLLRELNRNVPLSFENGLCGIGWGIEFLVQHGYMKGDTDEILKEVDKRVMEYDPLRIDDVSLRRGLGGIVMYIVARLTSKKRLGNLPFDVAYLEDLKEAISFINLSEDKENPKDLENQFLLALRGDYFLPPVLPDPLQPSCSLLEETYSSFGLELGLTGALLANLSTAVSWSVKKTKNSKLLGRAVLVFEVKARAANYGVGTYETQLLQAIILSKRVPVVVHLYNGNEPFISEKKQGVLYIYVPAISEPGYKLEPEKREWLYYRSLFLLLTPYIERYSSCCFHLNYMHEWMLAEALKQQYPSSKICLTLHYTDWSFELLGDQRKLHEILYSSVDESSIKDGICRDKRLLCSVDRIIAIAKHSCQMLQDIYQIPSSKIMLIPHGLEDCYTILSSQERKDLKLKYGFVEEERLILFAGRLDPVKGIYQLVEAIVRLVPQYPQIRLIVAGEGNYSKIQEIARPYWSHIIFTGFISKTEIYDLCQICDMGVLPSLYEEFGYVALEMMMMCVPLIVGHTTGLSELVVHEETGLCISQNCDEIVQAIIRYLQFPMYAQTLARKGRVRYLEFYKEDRFYRNMETFYNQLDENESSISLN